MNELNENLLVAMTQQSMLQEQSNAITEALNLKTMEVEHITNQLKEYDSQTSKLEDIKFKAGLAAQGGACIDCEDV